ncbi:F-box domain-containing protein [Heracleum sosnowskyi]|uniref:F-box domain-containing protein n=1 Tax=Heracleum sosnowskyi TaxID=360622 RepID=A0AAD8N2V5_9APIA|nr:F-box domain-containing protein [Heracleum sosnowskyi]KAK1393932.1 F-box domain-containing protein [Heracleum sosnowskyi]
MDTRVCSRAARSGNLVRKCLIDWTTLPNELVIQIFSYLNNRDRARLSSSCRSWRFLGSSSDLWKSLDLRMYNCDARTANLLASRCSNLRKLRFRGDDVARVLTSLKASNLREISGDLCMSINSDTLCSIAVHHDELEILQLGPEPCERIHDMDLQKIAPFCGNLRKLSLSGIRKVDSVAFDALARWCQNLTDISLHDCVNVDLKSLGKVVSVRFLSVAGTLNFQEDGRFVTYRSNKDKLLITPSTDIFKAVASLFDNTAGDERTVFSNWRTSINVKRNLNEVMNWLERILSLSLQCIAESNSLGSDNFWLDQGVALSVSLAKSLQEDVQEQAAAALGTFVFNDDNETRESVRCAAVIREGGVLQLLHLSKSWREVLQSVAVKALSNLSVNSEVAKAIAEDGGISNIVNLARSTYISVAEHAATVLWNLSAEEHKDAIAEVSGLQALIDLIYKWPTGGDALLESAVAALRNMAVSYKCSMLVIELGGLNALVSVVQRCNHEGVLEEVACALTNIASQKNISKAALRQEVSALEVLIQLTRSPYDAVREAAVDELMNLSIYGEKWVTVAAAGGVQALVALANSCSDASHSLRKKAAFTLCGLSVTKTNSIAIGREGGIAVLAALVQPGAEFYDLMNIFELNGLPSDENPNYSGAAEYLYQPVF